MLGLRKTQRSAALIVIDTMLAALPLRKPRLEQAPDTEARACREYSSVCP
jgi:hypothetical protein